MMEWKEACTQSHNRSISLVDVGYSFNFHFIVAIHAPLDLGQVIEEAK